jgi:hypothetical protein
VPARAAQLTEGVVHDVAGGPHVAHIAHGDVQLVADAAGDDRELVEEVVDHIVHALGQAAA